jgi:hypothetical protein
VRRSTLPARTKRCAIFAAMATLAAYVGLSASASPARAVGLCGAPPAAGWSFFAELPYGGASLQVWHYGHYFVVRGATLVANGKTNLSIEAGSVYQGNDLGLSGSIGTAPNGGWCSYFNGEYIWGAMGFDLGGGAQHHDGNLACYASLGRCNANT